jgi:hypothetical protein
VLATDIAQAEPNFIYTAIDKVANGGRFLDKTPKNSLRVPYLNALFPDAMFIFLHRDGRANVASLIEGWNARHGISYRLPLRIDLGSVRGRYWSYLLPPEWRSAAQTTVEQVAALQYRMANETALDDLKLIGSDRAVRIGFEEFLARPRVVTARLFGLLGISQSDRMNQFAASLGEHIVSSVTPPRPDKWRDRVAQLERVLPEVAPTMQRLGYEVNARQ